MLEIHIDKIELVKALKVLKPLVDTGSAKPMLANVRLDAHAGADPISQDNGLSLRSYGCSGTADTGRVTLFATDYVAALGIEVEGLVTAPGSMLLPLAKILDVLKSAPAGPVMIREIDNQWYVLEAGPVHFRFPGIDVGLYPADGSTAQPFRFAIEGVAMARAISCTLPFTQTLEARKNLMGVHLRQKNGTSIWTATDGHRLGRQEIPVESGDTESPGVILPRSALKAWLGALAWKSPPMVTVHFGDVDTKHYAFMVPGLMFTGRVIEGIYPNVGNIIPTSVEHVMEAEPKAVKDLLAAAISMSRERIKPVKLSLALDSLEAESERTEDGSISQRLAVIYRGEPVCIGMNATYAVDVLKLANGHAAVRLGLNGPLQPMLWTFPEEPGFTGVVMPLRIEW